MDGMRFVLPIHGHGTLAADVIVRYKLPCAATLVQVDAVATTAAVGSIKIGLVDNDDAYLKALTVGASGTYVTADRGNFDGDLSGHDTAECPHLAKATELLITIAHGSMINPDFALTFLEG